MGGRQQHGWVRLWRGQRGATAVEYALIAGLISILIIGSVTLIGTGVEANFDKLVEKFQGT